MEINYRCPKAIVDASQKLITQNKERFPKKILAWEQVEREKKPQKQEVTGEIRFQQFQSQREEILFIIKEIEARLKRGSNLSDIAILFRTNMQPRFLMEQLMAEYEDYLYIKIMPSDVGTIPFYEKFGFEIYDNYSAMEVKRL